MEKIVSLCETVFFILLINGVFRLSPVREGDYRIVFCVKRYIRTDQVLAKYNMRKIEDILRTAFYSFVVSILRVALG